MKNVGKDPQRDGSISVAEPIGNHMDRHTRTQQDGCMDVAQIVQSSVRQQDQRRRHFHSLDATHIARSEPTGGGSQ